MIYSLFGDKTIENKVLALVKGRIEAAQSKYDEGCISLEQNCVEEHKAVDSKKDAAKLTLADELVKEVVGKLL